MISTCIYCGCGCLLDYEVKDNKIVKVKGVSSDEVSNGRPCIKGLMIHEVFSKNRITEPLINGKPASLSEAFKVIHERTKDLAPNEVFFNNSGKVTNEDNFVIQEFANKCFNSTNIDSCCGRLCHNATVMGMRDVFGTPNLTVMNNISKVDTLFIIGSEPEKSYPVFYNKVLQSKVKVLRVHSFLKGCTPDSCVITIQPGSETCLLNGLINELISKGVNSKALSFNELIECVKPFNKKRVCETCRISLKDYNSLIKAVSKSKNFGVFHGMGLTQHVNSIENVHSLLNLVLLKKGLILSLRGEINVQGAGDVLIKSEEVKGLNLIEALMLSPVKAAFLTEFNPYNSMPDLGLLKKRLSDTFIVYFGAFHNETSRRADVVIPIASILESNGSITNGERRLRKVSPVINGSNQLWAVLKKLALIYGSKINYSESKDITKAIIRKVPEYSIININELYRGVDCWADKMIKREKFIPEVFDGFGDLPNLKYPFILTTFRSAFAFLSNEVSEGSESLSNLQEKPGFYFNKDDLTDLGISEGGLINVISTVSSLKGPAFSSPRIPKGIIAAYIHYDKIPVNKLFPLKFDEESFTPNYKSVSVRVETLLP